LLPAYSHNDYNNRRPFHDAIAAGMRGVEADLFLEGEQLLVGHGRGDLSSEGTLERLYLAPLRDRWQRCGRLLADSGEFLLTLELKEKDPFAFGLLVRQLTAYRDVMERGPVRVVMVGWWPPESSAWPAFLGVQLPQEDDPLSGIATAGPPVGLVSVDYSRSLRWNGRGTPSGSAVAALAQARTAATALGVPLRVHQVPPNSAVHRWLLQDGVDLIGLKSLGEAALLPRP
jgi:hypothetical protein